jgi:hypothetical protein
MSNKKSQLYEQEIKERLAELSATKNILPDLSSAVKAKYIQKANLLAKKAVSKSPLSRPTIWTTQLFKEVRMGTIATIMIILGLVLGGTSATAYASQDDLPNQFLYPVKILSENIQADLTTNNETKLALALEFAETRIEEIVQLKAEGLMPPEPVYANLEMQIQKAIMLATQLGESKLEPALLQIRDRLQIQEKLVSQDDQDPILLRTRTLLQERIQLVNTGLGNLNGFYYEAQNGWENTPLMNQGDTQQNQEMNQNQEQAPGNGQGSPTNGTTIETGTPQSTNNGSGATGGSNNPGYGSPTKTPLQNGPGKK